MRLKPSKPALLASFLTVAMLFSSPGMRPDVPSQSSVDPTYAGRNTPYSSQRPDRPEVLPTATSINDTIPLRQFLHERIGELPKDDYLWLTMLDGSYLRKGGSDLALFLQRLADGTLPPASGRTKVTPDHSPLEMWKVPIDAGDTFYDAEMNAIARGHQDLLVLCTDQDCVDICNERGWFGYGGLIQPSQAYGSAKHPLMMTKLMAFNQISAAGYRFIFVEGDVWLRHDPFPYFPDLSPDGSHSVAFTFEGSADVNAGVILSGGGYRAAELWRRALENYINVPGQWEQGAINHVLELTYPNYTVGMHERKAATPWGLGVHYLDRHRFVQYHLSYGVAAESVLFHGTCIDDYEIRRIVAANHGFAQDVDGYYSQPRKILAVDALVGDTESLQATFAVIVGLAAESGRALLLPPTALYLNASTMPPVRNRDVWSVIPFEETAREYGVTLLEPRYLLHRQQYQTASSDLRLLDVRMRPSYAQLSKALLSPVYSDAEIVSLNMGTMPSRPFEHWQDVPQNFRRVRMCYDLWTTPGCAATCLREPFVAHCERPAAKRRGELWAMQKPRLYPSPSEDAV
ncbi:uncharacterized protein L969DRAFT_53420 [Mixia osmundae IAM 14324]|uniref:Nucleotide-diphospho-sugar transferase domain-containing protein n=1 Tax=Mixia osmundae (strain CBS 9802 / IAM 14324 / JCM 22182 / KY 12970) TaxID=764103 RepID=G7DV06_MIXOS|nr:uncharacterized protein L969DRAFT_53420 [Mixia osmundae IAM 14324]KEI37251.1 hypothetical protein L969DRAFT_53420 [Mixia osmundae IAM 14324]GAA94416.1 hypothetical protein E5Q_01068 [Mixia osmundae IAM 14324]